MTHELLIKIDDTINVVFEKSKERCSIEYAERIKSLAALIEARAKAK